MAYDTYVTFGKSTNQPIADVLRLYVPLPSYLEKKDGAPLLLVAAAGDAFTDKSWAISSPQARHAKKFS